MWKVYNFITIFICGLIRPQSGSVIYSHYETTHRRICSNEFGPICCPGWYNSINAPCSIPACAGNCGDRGRCVEPDTCLCANGLMKFSCVQDEQMQSDQPENSCPNSCLGRGECEVGRCLCKAGYGGEKCEIEIEAKCYLNSHRGLCVDPLYMPTAVGNMSTLLNREMCCNSFGRAWGEPCEPCWTTYCGHGYHQRNGVCEDIDECEIPGICLGGWCRNMEGSFRCGCPDGYTVDNSTLACTYSQSICDLYGEHCTPGGRCIAMENWNFRCICDRGYVRSRDQKACTPKTQQPFDICSVYGQSICKNGVCIPREHSYECVCNPGFESTVDRKSCRYRLDMCNLHRGQLCRNGRCISVDRDYYCECSAGYLLSPDRHRCTARHPFGSYQDPDYHVSTESYIITNRFDNSLIDSFSYQQDKAITTDYWTAAPIDHSIIKPTYHRKPAPCDQQHIRIRCFGGFCLNLGGSAAYMCECLPGFTATHDGHFCKELRV